MEKYSRQGHIWSKSINKRLGTAQIDSAETDGDWFLLPLHTPLEGNQNSPSSNRPNENSSSNRSIDASVPFPDPSLPSEYHESITHYPGHNMGSDSRIWPRPSDTCPYECNILTQNFQGLKDGDKLENTIGMMIVKGVHGYCMQEAWLTGSFFTTILGHILFHHDMVNKTCQWSRFSSDVAIILVPELLRACNMAVKLPPRTSEINS